MPKKSSEIKDKSKKMPPKINNLKLKNPPKNDDSESDWISEDEDSDGEFKKYLKLKKEKNKNSKNEKNNKIITRSISKKK